MASGDYADAVLFNRHTDRVFVDAVEAGLIVELTEHVSAAPNLQAHTYPVSWEAMQALGDDRIFGMPKMTVMRQDPYLYRKDWADAVGYRMPADGFVSIDQFTDLLRRFTQDDPDGNGRNDSWGYAVYAPGGNLRLIVDQAFGLQDWHESSGRYAYINSEYDRQSDNYQNALAYSAMLHREGLVDPDGITLTTHGAMRERLYQGLTGVLRDFGGSGWTRLSNMRKVDPGAEIAYLYGVKDANGVARGRTSFNTGYFTFWTILDQAEDKAAAIVNAFDWTVSDEGWEFMTHGVEGVTYTMSGGERQYSEVFAGYQVKWNLLRRHNDPAFLISNATPADLFPTVLSALDQSMEMAVPTITRGYRPPVSDEPGLADAMTELDRARTRIIAGELPASAWGAALDEWYANGGETYVRQMNDYLVGLYQ